ncbi:sigma-70 family RNA polymerase sigma factor [Actinomadura fulvescens]|uniref:Sigma-70 family RNA polymerase sigma factor n=1 Tax=Actinomadura fulvescens TaxID=46160 RepID=A0ABN3QR62_9ACTN
MTKDRFEQLYREHHDEVLRYAARQAGPEHAADIAAETFTIAWRRIDDVPDGAALPWLYVVARNLIANQGRRDARRREVPEPFDSTHAHPVEPDHADSVHRREAALTALRGLSDDDRTMIRLIGWEGMDRGRVATALGVSPGAATVRLHRTRKRLRELLDPRRPSPFQAIGAAAMIAAATVLIAVGPRVLDARFMSFRATGDPIWTQLRAEGELRGQVPPGGDTGKVRPLSPALAAGAAIRTAPCPEWTGVPAANGGEVAVCEPPALDGEMPVNFEGSLWREDPDVYLYQGYVDRNVARLVLEPKGGGKRLPVPLFDIHLAGIKEFGLSLKAGSESALRAFDAQGQELYDSRDDDRGDEWPL